MIFQPILDWNKAIMVFFNFFQFYCYFFGIFYYASSKDETKQYFLFSLSQSFPTYFLFSLFLSLFQPILAWNEAIKVFFNFLNFFAIFLEFSITVRVRTKRINSFFFLFFSVFSKLLWLEKKPKTNFWIFWIFLLFFWIFNYVSGKDERER